ncbi:MAG: hypothetical protein DRH10_00600 [Deltaproteobacteria bacterium]|nr:MAG: hypothetical protein DRH10_00600 [Deltaproteobacteria bacterium]
MAARKTTTPRKATPKKKPAAKQTAKPLPATEEQQPVVEAVEEAPPEVELEVMPPEATKPPMSKTWNRVDSLSDDDMDVEAASVITSYQRTFVLLRFRAGGKLTGQVQVIEKLKYKPSTGKFSGSS